MLSERTRTRIEHAVDTRSVRFGAWLVRRTRGGATRLWHRRAIVLTTVGRRSGRPRTVLVQAFRDGDDILVVAANSGMERPPGWYFNLLSEPAVDGELDGAVLHLRAVPVTEAAERERCWREVVLATAPDYAKYEKRLGRVPPMFRLVTDDRPSRRARPNG